MYMYKYFYGYSFIYNEVYWLICFYSLMIGQKFWQLRYHRLCSQKVRVISVNSGRILMAWFPTFTLNLSSYYMPLFNNKQSPFNSQCILSFDKVFLITGWPIAWLWCIGQQYFRSVSHMDFPCRSIAISLAIIATNMESFIGSKN